MTPGAIARALAIALVLPLSGCVIVIGTSPTPLSEAQIIVIVRTDDSGAAISGAGVAVLRAGSNEVLSRGVTGPDGRVALSVGGADGLRVVVDAPTGYRVPASGSRSIEIVLVAVSDPVTVRLARVR